MWMWVKITVTAENGVDKQVYQMLQAAEGDALDAAIADALELLDDGR